MVSGIEAPPKPRLAGLVVLLRRVVEVELVSWSCQLGAIGRGSGTTHLRHGCRE